MPHHSRRRRFAKGCILAASLLIAGAWVFSELCTLSYTSHPHLRADSTEREFSYVKAELLAGAFRFFQPASEAWRIRMLRQEVQCQAAASRGASDKAAADRFRSQTAMLEARAQALASANHPLRRDRAAAGWSIQWRPFWRESRLSWFARFGGQLPAARPSPRAAAPPGSETIFPLWLILIPLAFPAVRCLRKRPLPGHCRKCNYNLTGNVTGICPECGKATSVTK